MVERSAFEELPEDSQMTVSQPDGPYKFKDPHDAAVQSNEYVFAQSLAVHTGSVRSVGALKAGDFMMSGSIDMSNKLYAMNNQVGRYDFVREIMLHEGFVMDIIPNATGTGFFSAGKDGKIFAIDLEGNPILEYSGHENVVNSLSQCMESEFVSGSWDGTAKIWDVNTGQVKETLGGHTHAVSVLTLPNGITITGSQDKKIRLWYGGKMEREFVAHDDIIRGFTEVPNFNGFASCSNDEVVKLWSMDGSHLMDFKGHTGFVFAIDCLETGEIVSGGDDCTVKLWENGACKQTIQLPKTVWGLTHNRHNDLIIGCENKHLYTFTRDMDRIETGPDFKEYEDECKANAQGEQIDLSKLLEFSTQVQGKVRGKSDGFVQVFKDNGVAKAYSYSASEDKWTELGEVLNPDQATKGTGQANDTKFYEGDALFGAGEYDKIIDVDLGDGVYRKLPCNNGANYLETADKFCVRENLSKSYVEQIVQFLRANTLPYATRDLSQAAGGAAAGGASQAAQQKPKCGKIPMTTQIYYDQVKLDGCKKKILEFDAELQVMNDKDKIYFESLIKVLSQTQFYHKSEVSPQQLEVIRKLLEFPIDKVFPCIDLYRIYLLHPSSYEQFASSDAGAFFIQQLMRYISDVSLPKPVLMLGLRALNNLFKNQSSSHVASLRRDLILENATKHLSHSDKQVRQAAITLILNYSVLFLTKDDDEGRIQAISALSTCSAGEKDLQNTLRMAFALGNLTHKNSDAADLVKTLCIQLPDVSGLEAAAGEKDVDKTKSTITEIAALLAEQ